jgi:F0F1-type ATP synthase membrane subunit b/b'
MIRKIIAGILIAISAILLGLSIAGIVLIQAYKEPLTQFSTTRLQTIDTELGQAQTALQNAALELERTLRAVEAAEISLETLKADFTQAKALFGDVNGTLDKQLLPGLKTSRAKIEQAKSSLLELQASLTKVNALPFASLSLPSDKLLNDLITSADSMDILIIQVESMAKKASGFLDDASYLMEGDLTETKDNLRNFLTVVREYDQKFSGWREQIATLTESLPGWLQTVAISLTIFLLWFGLSQISMIRHGLALWQDGQQQEKPQAVLQEEAPGSGEKHLPAAQTPGIP